MAEKMKPLKTNTRWTRDPEYKERDTKYVNNPAPKREVIWGRSSTDRPYQRGRGGRGQRGGRDRRRGRYNNFSAGGFIPEKRPEFKYEEGNFPSLGGKPKTPVNKVCLDWRNAAIKGASKPDPIQNLKTSKDSMVVKHNFTEIDLDNFQAGYDSYDEFDSDDGFPSKGGFMD